MQQEIFITTKDGFNLSAHFFQPTTDFENVVVVVPAVGVKKHYYEKFARYLATENMAVYTFDYRGIGDSKPKSLIGFKATVSDWGEKDLESIIQHALDKHPTKTFNVVTHSGGGMLMGLAPSLKKAASILTVASPRGSLSDWKGFDFWKMSIMVYFLLPVPPIFWGYFPGKLLKVCENLPKKVAREWCYWGRHPKSVIGRRPDKESQYQNITSTILALSFEKDFYAVKESVDKIDQLYTSANVLRKHFTADDINEKAVGHFSFFKSEYSKYYWLIAKDFIEEK